MLKLFTIHDSKAEAFIQPFFSPATGTAIRSFETACNDATSDFHHHAADYTLFELGDFDQDTAIFTLHAAPINLGCAITYVRETPPTQETTPTLSRITGAN